MASELILKIVPIYGFASGRAILFHGRTVGHFAWNREKNKAEMMLELDPMPLPQAICLTAYASHCIISLNSPAYIEVKHVNKLERKALAANLFFPKGQGMQWMMEDWRRACASSIFDPYGFIISQGRMQDLPFGNYPTSEKGCGWIAAYNLCKACGKEQFMQETADTLARANLFHERYGENLFALQSFLKSKKIPARWCPGTTGMIQNRMAGSGAGPIMRSILPLAMGSITFTMISMEEGMISLLPMHSSGGPASCLLRHCCMSAGRMCLMHSF